ncbi:hypothetical protein PYCC9005_003711 [Savitreella phatthalungensis]
MSSTTTGPQPITIDKGKKTGDIYELDLLPALHPLPLRQDPNLVQGESPAQFAAALRKVRHLTAKAKRINNPARPGKEPVAPKSWRGPPSPDELEAYEGQTHLADVKIAISGDIERLEFDLDIHTKRAATWLHNDTHVCLQAFEETHFEVLTRDSAVIDSDTALAHERNITIGVDKIASLKTDKTNTRTETYPLGPVFSDLLWDPVSGRQGFVVHENRATRTKCRMKFQARRKPGMALTETIRSVKFQLLFLRRPFRSESLIWDMASDHGEAIANSTFPTFRPRRVIAIDFDQAGIITDVRLDNLAA